MQTHKSCENGPEGKILQETKKGTHKWHVTNV